jgi:ribosomal protein S18 acetylase RimI-like enzyme
VIDLTDAVPMAIDRRQHAAGRRQLPPSAAGEATWSEDESTENISPRELDRLGATFAQEAAHRRVDPRHHADGRAGAAAARDAGRPRRHRSCDPGAEAGHRRSTTSTPRARRSRARRRRCRPPVRVASSPTTTPARRPRPTPTSRDHGSRRHRRRSRGAVAAHPGAQRPRGHRRSTDAALSASLARLLASPEVGGAWLVERGGAVIGYAIVTYGYDLEYGGRDAVLTELWIDAGPRRRRRHRRAAAALEPHLVAAGVGALHLQVRPDNPARHLYDRAGFVASPRIVMTRKLG